VPGAARSQLERDARHRLLVGRLDDVDEVEVPQRGPLRLHAGAELLDLAVDLADPRRVVLDRLNALRRERGEHDVCRHGFLLGRWASPCTEASARDAVFSLLMRLRHSLAGAVVALLAVPAAAAGADAPPAFTQPPQKSYV